MYEEQTGACAAGPLQKSVDRSPVDSAMGQIGRHQDETFALLDQLEIKLMNALRPSPPQTDNVAKASPQEVPESPLHGVALNYRAAAEGINIRILKLMNRITV